MAAAPQGFSGSSVDELESWLEQSGIDVASYGQAASKSVDLLLQEVRRQLPPDCLHPHPAPGLLPARPAQVPAQAAASPTCWHHCCRSRTARRC